MNYFSVLLRIIFLLCIKNYFLHGPRIIYFRGIANLFFGLQCIAGLAFEVDWFESSTNPWSTWATVYDKRRLQTCSLAHCSKVL